MLYPFYESSSECFDFMVGDVKLQTDLQQFDKVYKVLVVFRVLELASEQDRSQVQCPE
jgi:hypothetical protein